MVLCGILFFSPFFRSHSHSLYSTINPSISHPFTYFAMSWWYSHSFSCKHTHTMYWMKTVDFTRWPFRLVRCDKYFIMEISFYFHTFDDDDGERVSEGLLERKEKGNYLTMDSFNSARAQQWSLLNEYHWMMSL